MRYAVDLMCMSDMYACEYYRYMKYESNVFM